MPVDGFIIFFDGIPFIHGNDNTLAALVRDAGNLCVLLRHALGSVNYDDNDIRALHRRNSSDNAEALKFLLDPALSAQSGRVNKYIFAILPGYCRVNGIPRCPGNIRDNHTIFAEQTIDN